MIYPIALSLFGFWLADFVAVLLIGAYLGPEMTVGTMLRALPLSLVRMIWAMEFLRHTSHKTFWETVTIVARRKRMVGCAIRGVSIGIVDVLVHLAAIAAIWALGGTVVVLCVGTIGVSMAMAYGCLWLFRWDPVRSKKSSLRDEK